MAWLYRGLLRKPRLRMLRPWLRQFILSDAPLLACNSTAFRMPHRCFLMMQTTVLIGHRRLRMAQAYHGFHPFSAQVRLVSCQSFRPSVLIAKARAVFTVLPLNSLNGTLPWAGQVSQVGSPIILGALQILPAFSH